MLSPCYSRITTAPFTLTDTSGGDIFNGTSEEFVGVRRFSFSKTSRDSPYFCFVIFIPFDELGGEGETFANRDLEGRDAVVIANEIGGNAVLIEVEVLIFTRLHGSLQTVFGMIDASTHSCAVSFPGEFAEFDGGDETSDDLRSEE